MRFAVRRMGGAAANCTTLKSRPFPFIIFHTLPFMRTKGNPKNRRGETISGSTTATALNRMPTALLKQSKGLRFLTLRHCVRPLSEIVSAAGQADTCELAECFRVAACQDCEIERMRITGTPRGGGEGCGPYSPADCNAPLRHSADGPYSGYSATNSSQLCNGQSSVCPATLRSTSMQVTS